MEGTASQRPLGVGIIGTGRVAANHANACRAVEEVALRAVADVDQGRLQEFLARFASPGTGTGDGPGAPAVAGYADYAELLQRPDVDLVLVTLPHWLHAEATIRALEAGKHVLIEKPMAMTLEECDRMIQAAARAGRRLAVGLTHHFHAIPPLAKELLDSGRFGRIAWGTEVMYATRRLGANPPWFYDRSLGGGQLLGNGVHFVDRLCWTIGSSGGGPGDATPAAPDRARPVAVKALVGTFFNDYAADDGAVLFIQFDTGQVATLHLTGHYAGAARYEAEYVAARGMVRYGRELQATHPETPDDATYHPIPVEKHNGFERQLRDLAGAIREGRSPMVPGEWGRMVLAVLLAAEESSRSGREVLL
ncbi:MAG TPA: Gfo/Idh/MocA family oxidoreductase [Chloroflexota bacterium]|nr:Gfo/Idh/MocA family oxidoreductase [Chloroflexota bacterium]